MARYRVSRKAIHDLDGIWFSIAKENEAAAERQLDRIYDAFEMFARLPRVGRARPDIAQRIRSFVVDNYVIFYELATPGVRIVRVWDGRQDPERLKREF